MSNDRRSEPPDLEPETRTRDWPGASYWALVVVAGAFLVFHTWQTRAEESGFAQFLGMFGGVLFVIVGVNATGRRLQRLYRDEKGRPLPIGRKSRAEWKHKNGLCDCKPDNSKPQRDENGSLPHE